jgi:hypothetical protein
MSLKRSALEPEIARQGHLEFVLHPRIYADGKGGFDGRFVVEHHQDHGWLQTFLDHFHNGPCTSALMRLPRGSAAWHAQSRHARSLHRLLMEGTTRTLRTKQFPPDCWQRVRPWPAALFACHSIGYWWGLHFGVGQSAHRLE